MSEIQKRHLARVRSKAHATQKKNGQYSVMGRVSAHLVKHLQTPEEIHARYSRMGKKGAKVRHHKK